MLSGSLEYCLSPNALHFDLKPIHVLLQPILNVVADNCLDIATDKSGCCVLQLCVLHADEASKQRLMSEIIENALDLAEHPYGFVPFLLVINCL